MKNRSYAIHLILLILAIFATVLFISCTDKPDVEWRNPLDPENPDTHGDPYELSVQIGSGGIELNWAHVSQVPVAGYNIYRNVNEAGFSLLDDVGVVNSFVDTDVENGKRYQYYIAAFNAASEESDISNVASILINNHPYLVIEGENVTETAARMVDLTIIAYGATEMLLSNNADFSDATWEAYQTLKTWELATGAGTKTVYMQVKYDTNDESETITDDIEASLTNGTIIINNNDQFTDTKDVQIVVNGVGVDSIAISNDPITPGNENWVPFTNNMPWELALGEGTKTVHVEFMNNFLVQTSASDLIDPLPLDPSVVIEGGAGNIASRFCTLTIGASGATEMEISNTAFTATANGEIPDRSKSTKSSGGKSSQSTKSTSKISTVKSSPDEDRANTQDEQRTELDDSEAWEPFSTTRAWELATGDQPQKNVFVRVRNDFGIIREATDLITPLYPENYSFVIDQPDTTASNIITMVFTGNYIDSVQIAQQSDMQGGIWAEFGDTVYYDIAANQVVDGAPALTTPLAKDSRTVKNSNTELDEAYSIFVRFKNSFEVLSDILEDEVTVEIDGTIEINRGNQFAETRFVSLEIRSDDAEEMALSNSEQELIDTPQWRAYSATVHNYELETGTGIKTVFVRLRNSSGAVSSIYSDDIEPRIPTGSLRINNNAQTTLVRDVTLNVTAPGMNIETIFAEDSLFTNETYQPFVANVDFQLSVGEGTKTVYGKVRNDFMIESPLFSANINPQPIEPYVRILTNFVWVNTPDVVVSVRDVEALEVMLFNEGDSTDNWMTFPPSEQINFQLTGGDDAEKIVKAYFRHEFFTSEAALDTIGLDSQTSIQDFSWTTDAQDTVRAGAELSFDLQIADDPIGPEVNGTATVTVVGMVSNLPLQDMGGGNYTASVTVTDEMQAVQNAPVIARFTDRAGNVAVPDTADGEITFYVPPGAESFFGLGDTGLEMAMIWIAPGEFDMGTSGNEPFQRLNESPQHHVTVDEGYWMGKFEVTQEQWEAVVGNNPSFFDDDPNKPVEQISFTMIQNQFISVLNSFEDGDPWRLPSEAEWEFAARAGTQTWYYWGDDTLTAIDDNAWYVSNSNTSTHIVGGKNANPWGLHDIHGNVNEWCEDWYHDTYTNAPADGNPWLDPIGTDRIARGGNWNSRAPYCRAATRNHFTPDFTAHFLGVRLVRDGD
ncbi:formylglycine-generating enzyme family protein [bacterium]|nr:formylglycine-generating enzyme family protein [bacterium]